MDVLRCKCKQVLISRAHEDGAVYHSTRHCRPYDTSAANRLEHLRVRSVNASRRYRNRHIAKVDNIIERLDKIECDLRIALNSNPNSNVHFHAPPSPSYEPPFASSSPVFGGVRTCTCPFGKTCDVCRVFPAQARPDDTGVPGAGEKASQASTEKVASD